MSNGFFRSNRLSLMRSVVIFAAPIALCLIRPPLPRWLIVLSFFSSGAEVISTIPGVLVICNHGILNDLVLCLILSLYGSSATSVGQDMNCSDTKWVEQTRQRTNVEDSKQVVEIYRLIRQHELIRHDRYKLIKLYAGRLDSILVIRATCEPIRPHVVRSDSTRVNNIAELNRKHLKIKRMTDKSTQYVSTKYLWTPAISHTYVLAQHRILYVWCPPLFCEELTLDLEARL